MASWPYISRMGDAWDKSRCVHFNIRFLRETGWKEKENGAVVTDLLGERVKPIAI